MWCDIFVWNCLVDFSWYVVVVLIVLSNLLSLGFYVYFVLFILVFGIKNEIIEF